MGLAAGDHLLGRTLEDHLAAGVSRFRTEVDDPVGAADDVEVVLHDDNAVAAGEKRVKGLQELFHIVEMEAGCRLVEDEEDLPLAAAAVAVLFHGKEIGELNALAFAAGKGAGALAELDVAETDGAKRLQPGGNLPGQGLFLAFKEGDGLVDAHIEDVVDILPLVADFEDVGLEAFAAAGLADHRHVGHELHADLDIAVALAFRTAAALLVEAEIGRRESAQLGVLLLGEELAVY